MKKISMILAASAMALGIYSCSKSGSANLKDNADSVSFAVGFGNANELINAIQGAKAQGENVDSALFFKGFEEGFNSDTTKLWYYVGQMQGVQAAMRFKDDSTLKKAVFLAGFKKALSLDSAARASQSDSINAIAQAYYEKKQEQERAKYEEEMQKQMEEQYGENKKKGAKQYGENKKKGAEFVANYKKQAGVKTTASGLAYQVLKEGNGDTPKATDMVQVNYVGKLIDDTVFDESKGKPAEFRVDQVIKGWTEMLQLMKVGEKVKVVIPQELAYGARFAGEKIPPFSTLVFEIELVKIVPAAAADSVAQH